MFVIGNDGSISKHQFRYDADTCVKKVVIGLSCRPKATKCFVYLHVKSHYVTMLQCKYNFKHKYLVVINVSNILASVVTFHFLRAKAATFFSAS